MRDIKFLISLERAPILNLGNDSGNLFVNYMKIYLEICLCFLEFQFYIDDVNLKLEISRSNMLNFKFQGLLLSGI